MAGRKYSPQQQAELDLLAAVHLEKVRAKAVLRATIEAQLADALNDLSIKESQQANRALASKVTKTDIGRALGTANWETIESVLARTAGDLTAADFDPRNKRYTLTNGNVQVTLDDAMLAEIAGWWDTPPEILAEAVREGYGWALYAVAPPTAFGIEIPVQVGPFGGRMIRHPVELWLDAENGKNKKDLVDWFSAQNVAPATALIAHFPAYDDEDAKWEAE